MEVKGLHRLLLNQMQDLYNAEQKQIQVFPGIALAIVDSEFRAIIDKHFEQTQYQVFRLEQIFEHLGEKPDGRECLAMKVLIQEMQDICRKDYGPCASEAALICALQHIEHYEIVGYGTVRSFARQLGDDASANLLQQTLNEEAQADRWLSELAEYEINLRAAEVSRNPSSLTLS